MPSNLLASTSHSSLTPPSLWTVYKVTRRADGRTYVGATRTSIPERIDSHVAMARFRPNHGGGPGTLAAAVRAALDAELTFEEAFEVAELDTTPSTEEARRLEREWIAKLGSAYPQGFNKTPGGSSLGGPANARPLTPGPFRFESMMQAVAAIGSARRAGCGGSHNVPHHRRNHGAHRIGDIRLGRQPPLVLPHPTDPDAPPVGPATFARLTCVPRATVLERYHRLVEPCDPAELSCDKALAALLDHDDRPVVIDLPLPDGRVLFGDVRELVRQVLDDLNWRRPERLGQSAIRARLRRLSGWPARVCPESLARAFGSRRGRPV